MIFETPDNYVGHEHLDFFYWKIDECETVKFNYKKFEDEVGKEVLIETLFVKRTQQEVVFSRAVAAEAEAWRK